MDSNPRTVSTREYQASHGLPLGNRLSRRTLAIENRRFAGTGGVSSENREIGFAPAFLDTVTGVVYRARFADGRPAPVHVLEGLPASLTESHSSTGVVTAVKTSVVSGFLRNGRFYTREQAASAVAELRTA